MADIVNSIKSACCRLAWRAVKLCKTWRLSPSIAFRRDINLFAPQLPHRAANKFDGKASELGTVRHSGEDAAGTVNLRRSTSEVVHAKRLWTRPTVIPIFAPDEIPAPVGLPVPVALPVPVELPALIDIPVSIETPELVSRKPSYVTLNCRTMEEAKSAGKDSGSVSAHTTPRCIRNAIPDVRVVVFCCVMVDPSTEAVVHQSTIVSEYVVPVDPSLTKVLEEVLEEVLVQAGVTTSGVVYLLE